jgi:DNA-binding PadR family transcriptional regulator
MSVSRLVTLGLLDEHGPLYGHQLRRQAEAKHVESWGGVSPGALYRELHQLEAEGLIEVLRSEQVGRRPPRTVYRVSEAGHAALRVLREETLSSFVRPPDVVGVGLLFGALEDPEELLALLEHRRKAATDALETLRAKRARLEEHGPLSPSVYAVFRRSELYIQAELTWHEEYAALAVTKARKSVGAGTPRARAQGIARSRRRPEDHPGAAPTPVADEQGA